LCVSGAPQKFRNLAPEWQGVAGVWRVQLFPIAPSGIDGPGNRGRGIGIANKLRAYRLQDIGFDTLDANRQIGFRDDERPLVRNIGGGRRLLLRPRPRRGESSGTRGGRGGAGAGGGFFLVHG
jgi:hypothetical protein